MWEHLQREPGYRLLCNLYLDKSGTLPNVSGADSREQFYFEAIRKDMAVEVLERPNREVRGIELADM